ncbi:MAG: VOC family protein, partial [Comamonas sp.]|nr:VOC family protein [Comamonas sp.]
QNARPATPDLPFLCGDLTPRVLRVPEGKVREHANGVQGVAYLHIAVHDAAATLARYRTLLGLQDSAHTDAGTASLQLGNTQLKLETASSSRAAAARLAQQGEGLFAVGLYTTQASLLGSITQGNTHGAHIVLLPQGLPRTAHTQSVFA